MKIFVKAKPKAQEEKVLKIDDNRFWPGITPKGCRNRRLASSLTSSCFITW